LVGQRSRVWIALISIPGTFVAVARVVAARKLGEPANRPDKGHYRKSSLRRFRADMAPAIHDAPNHFYGNAAMNVRISRNTSVSCVANT